MSTQSTLQQLAEYRLRENLSYPDLAARIAARVGHPVDASVVYRALTGERVPTELTLYKFREFLKAEQRPVRTRRRVAASA
jgi:hypothetical protein